MLFPSIQIRLIERYQYVGPDDVRQSLVGFVNQSYPNDFDKVHPILSLLASRDASVRFFFRGSAERRAKGLQQLIRLLCFTGRLLSRGWAGQWTCGMRKRGSGSASRPWGGATTWKTFCPRCLKCAASPRYENKSLSLPSLPYTSDFFLPLFLSLCLHHHGEMRPWPVTKSFRSRRSFISNALSLRSDVISSIKVLSLAGTSASSSRIPMESSPTGPWCSHRTLHFKP